MMDYDTRLCTQIFNCIKQGHHNREDIAVCMGMSVPDMIHTLFNNVGSGFIRVEDDSNYYIRIELDSLSNDTNIYPKYERSEVYDVFDNYVNPVCAFLKRPLLDKMTAAYAGYVAFMVHYKCDDGVHADISWIADHCENSAASVVNLLCNHGVASENVKDPDYESHFHKINEVYITSSYNDLVHAISSGYTVISTVNVYGHSFNEILAGRSDKFTCYYDYHIGYCVVAGCMIRDGMIGCVMPWSYTDVVWLTPHYINNESYTWYIIK